MIGSELEFFLYRESYDEARAKKFEDLTPSVPYILDYHILAAGYDEEFMREIRLAMAKAGMRVESSKGEAWPGQHEINFRYADALTVADDHVIYKTGVKALAYQRGCSVTFMVPSSAVSAPPTRPASITAAKRQKLLRTARYYLAGVARAPQCRFDALLVNGRNNAIRGMLSQRGH